MHLLQAISPMDFPAHRSVASERHTMPRRAQSAQRVPAPASANPPDNKVEEERAGGVDPSIANRADTLRDIALMPLVQTCDRKGRGNCERCRHRHEPVSDNSNRAVPRVAEDDPDHSVAEEVTNFAEDLVDFTSEVVMPLTENGSPNGVEQ